jgi:protease IV
MGWFTSKGSKMIDSDATQLSDGGDGRWERALISKLATAALAEQRRSRRWGIFFKLLFFAYLTFLLAALIDWGATGVGGSRKHTAMVDLTGIIAPGGDASAEKINASLQAAFKDKNTQGVILRINSPGGSPVQAQTIYDEMRRLRKKYPEIPLYAVVEDICASGGYFVAAGADRIYVTKSSIVGSIGVLMNGFGFTGLMDKLGVERRLLTAGENKGMLDPFSPLAEKDKVYIQKLLDDVHQQFISVVREGRGKRLKETPDMFSGLFWTGDKSVELGLADGYGTLESVARDVIKAEDIIDYTQKEGIAERVAKRFGAAAASTLAEMALRSSPLLR